jgi:hypothetical protein
MGSKRNQNKNIEHYMMNGNLVRVYFNLIRDFEFEIKYNNTIVLRKNWGINQYLWSTERIVSPWLAKRSATWLPSL